MALNLINSVQSYIEYPIIGAPSASISSNADYVRTNSVTGAPCYVFTGTSRTMNFTVNRKTVTITVLAVGGGGGGSTGATGYNGGGGGGGGGVVETTYIITASTTLSISVGTGGAGVKKNDLTVSGKGNNTTITFSSVPGGSIGNIVAYGGGSGGYNGAITGYGGAGGSGGGGCRDMYAVTSGVNVYTGGSAVTTDSNIAFAGGSGGPGTYGYTSGVKIGSGGGGGAGSAGGNGGNTTINGTTVSNEIPGCGGDGYASTILGPTYYWGAGGGGMTYNSTTTWNIASTTVSGYTFKNTGMGGLGGGGGGAGTAGAGNYSTLSGSTRTYNPITNTEYTTSEFSTVSGSKDNKKAGDAAAYSGSGGGASNLDFPNITLPSSIIISSAGAGGSGIVIIRIDSIV